MNTRVRGRDRCAFAVLACAAGGIAGCSFAFPLDDYDRGDGSGGAAETNSSSSSSTGVGGADGAGGAPPCGAGLYPPAATLLDTFDEGGRPTFIGCGLQMGGELEFAMPDSGELYCESQTSIPYCLTASSITLKVPEAVTAPIPGLQTFIWLRAADDSGEVRLLVEANGFGLSGIAGGVDFTIPLVTSSYDMFAAAWWRLAGDAGQLALLTSADGVEWVERGRGDCPLSLDGVFIALAANRYVNRAFPGSADLPAATARFDCLNVPAGCP